MIYLVILVASEVVVSTHIITQDTYFLDFSYFICSGSSSSIFSGENARATWLKSMARSTSLSGENARATWLKSIEVDKKGVC